MRLDLRLSPRRWGFRPVLSAAVVGNGSSFLGAGVWFDLPLGEHLVITPQFTPTWWRGATSERDLGFPLELRSRFELAGRYELPGASRGDSVWGAPWTTPPTQTSGP